MDAMSWIDAVKATKKLTVYSGNLSGNWAKIVTAAVPEFNKIAKAHGLGVSLVQLTDREFAKSGANIEYGIGNGAVEFEHDRTTYSGQFDGSAKHGLT
ncbi:MAG TPA: hypothetical protein VL096_14270, partial [Pirellulaceae bacterium]|nr:hypothetical protein [Pirellulaceae bacterium]